MNKKGYADGPHGQIHFRVCGDGAPLVLCHQSPVSLRQFEAAYGLLANAGIQAIGIDTPGFGQSAIPDRVPEIADYAKAIPAVLDHLGIDKANLLGHHTGSMVVTEAALRYGDRVEKLILNGPVPLTDEERTAWKALAEETKSWPPQADGSHLTAQWAFRLKVSPGWSNLDAMHRLLVEGMLAGDTAWYGFNAAFDYDHAMGISKIDHPCLVLTNTGDDAYQYARRALELRPDFSFRELVGGTHDIVDEQPEQWTQAVAEFIQS